MHKSYYIMLSKVNWSDFPFNVMYLLCEKLTIGRQRWMLGNQLGDHFSGGVILAGLDLVVNVVRSVWVSTDFTVISINVKCKRDRDFNIWTLNWSRIKFSFVEVERTIGGTGVRDKTRGCV